MKLFDAKHKIRLKGVVKRLGQRLAPGLWARAYRRFRLARYRAAGVAFCHIPKNGGSYVCSRLYGTNLGHIPAPQQVVELADAGMADVPVIAFVQDPVSRFCSAASHFFARGGEHSILEWRAAYAQITTLAELIDYLSGVADADRDPIFQSQDFYIAGADALAVARSIDFAIYPLSRLDEVMRRYDRDEQATDKDRRTNRSSRSAQFKQDLADDAALMQRVLDLYRSDLKYLA